MYDVYLYVYDYLMQVSRYIEEVYETDACYIYIKLDKKRIRLLKV